jgi:hypothetical protein
MPKTTQNQYANYYQHKCENELRINLTAELLTNEIRLSFHTDQSYSVSRLSRDDLEALRAIIEECLQDLDAPIQPDLQPEEEIQF